MLDRPVGLWLSNPSADPPWTGTTSGRQHYAVVGGGAYGCPIFLAAVLRFRAGADGFVHNEVVRFVSL